MSISAKVAPVTAWTAACPGKSLPTPYDLIAIDRIKFDQARPSVRPFACNQGRATAPEAIQNKVATARTISNGIGDKRDRFRRWMHGKCLKPIRAKRVCTCICPYIGSIPAVLPKFNVVDVLTAAMLPNENKLMLTAV